MITKFKGEYEFLSMDYPTKIIYNGFEFNNAETAFIACKSYSRDYGTFRYWNNYEYICRGY